MKSHYQSLYETWAYALLCLFFAFLFYVLDLLVSVSILRFTTKRKSKNMYEMHLKNVIDETWQFYVKEERKHRKHDE